jgi:hypothetical protein
MKQFDLLRQEIREWQMSASASGAPFVEPVMSLRTGKADKVKRPSVRQLKKRQPTAASIQNPKITMNYSQGGIT